MKFIIRTILFMVLTSFFVSLMFVMFLNKPHQNSDVSVINDKAKELVIAAHSQDDIDENNDDRSKALADLIKRVVRGEMKHVLNEFSQKEELLKNIQFKFKESAKQQQQQQQSSDNQQLEEQQKHKKDQQRKQKQIEEIQRLEKEHSLLLLKQQQQQQLLHNQQLEQQQKKLKQKADEIRQQKRHKQIEEIQRVEKEQILLKQQQQQQYQEKKEGLTMEMLHNKTYNKFTQDEIVEYYRVERISEKLFNKAFDLENDQDLNTLKFLFPEPMEHRDRVTDQLRVKLNAFAHKTIYIRGGSGNNQEKFEQDNCNVKTCTFSRDLDDISKADAVYSESALPDGYWRNRNKNQVLLSFQIESAVNAISIGRNINWTANYRRDSVINAPYERFTPFLNVTRLPSTPIRNFAKGKTKMAAWFVSNCGAPNGRDFLVRELKEFISIDIYGRCGKFSCEKTESECFKKLKTDYKFYLSFENSNCKDYVTEKLFWNGLLNDVVPIVMGAHRNEYKRIAPPNSYIHVDDFESPKQLAEYLKFLDGNDDAYNQYFLWKDTGRFINTKFMCRLCTMVHLAPLFPMWYSDGDKWWNRNTCVSPPFKNGRRSSYATWRGRTETRSYADYVRYGYPRL